MTIIVSDTSPICYLLLIHQIDLLPQLYGEVTIPQTVGDELKANQSPAVVQNWISRPPEWLRIVTITVSPDPILEPLDPGEREAILLAKQLAADLVILDDKAARQIASAMGLNIIGLLGILKDAARSGLIDLATSFEQLRAAGFWVAPCLLQRLLAEE
jgi:predicted nucleic acid-binding protein